MGNCGAGDAGATVPEAAGGEGAGAGADALRRKGLLEPKDGGGGDGDGGWAIVLWINEMGGEKESYVGLVSSEVLLGNHGRCLTVALCNSHPGDRGDRGLRGISVTGETNNGSKMGKELLFTVQSNLFFTSYHAPTCSVLSKRFCVVGPLVGAWRERGRGRSVRWLEGLGPPCQVSCFKR